MFTITQLSKAMLTAGLLTLGLSDHALAEDGTGNPDKSLKVIALTSDGMLLRFRSNRPERVKEIGFVSGLTGGDQWLIGVDFRVQDGMLYGVGNGGGIYVIDTMTAQASLVSSLTVPLSGTQFGVDFNPAADRLRIVSDTGQNLRHNVNSGGVTLTDGILTYTVPPATPVAALGVTGAAYTNNDLNQPSTGTTLFDIDAMLDQVVLQSPPNNGILVAAGKLGVDADAVAGFDMYSRLVDGVTVQNRAFAALLVGGAYGFYHVNTLTGTATMLGGFDYTVADIAVQMDQ